MHACLESLIRNAVYIFNLQVTNNGISAKNEFHDHLAWKQSRYATWGKNNLCTQQHFSMIGSSTLALNQSFLQATRGLQKPKQMKRRHYNDQHVYVSYIEHGTPLVLSTTRGMGKAATILYKRLASFLSDKWDENYSHTMGWLWWRLTFALLRVLICIRGAQSSVNLPILNSPINLQIIAVLRCVNIIVYTTSFNLEIELNFIFTCTKYYSLYMFAHFN